MNNLINGIQMLMMIVLMIINQSNQTIIEKYYNTASYASISNDN